MTSLTSSAAFVTACAGNSERAQSTMRIFATGLAVMLAPLVVFAQDASSNRADGAVIGWYEAADGDGTSELRVTAVFPDGTLTGSHHVKDFCCGKTEAYPLIGARLEGQILHFAVRSAEGSLVWYEGSWNGTGTLKVRLVGVPGTQTYRKVPDPFLKQFVD